MGSNLHVEGLWLSIALADYLLGKDSTHVRPFPKLGLILGETLDPSSQSVLVSLATLGNIGLNWWWRRRHKVWVLAAHVEVTFALAILGTQDAKSVSDVDQPTPISNDCPVVAMVVGDALIALGLCVVFTVLKDVINHSSCLVVQLTLVMTIPTR